LALLLPPWALLPLLLLAGKCAGIVCATSSMVFILGIMLTWCNLEQQQQRRSLISNILVLHSLCHI
jgi:hypothetical protein